LRLISYLTGVRRKFHLVGVKQLAGARHELAAAFISDQTRDVARWHFSDRIEWALLRQKRTLPRGQLLTLAVCTRPRP
jgi:hypothetical protein